MLLAANPLGGMSSIIFFALILGLMYFMMIRPQRKQQQQRQEMMSKLNVGDKVTTIGRLHGVVDSIDDDAKTVTLDCDGVYLVFDRAAIMRVDQQVAKESVESDNKPEETKPATEAKDAVEDVKEDATDATKDAKDDLGE